MEHVRVGEGADAADLDDVVAAPVHDRLGPGRKTVCRPYLS